VASIQEVNPDRGICSVGLCLGVMFMETILSFFAFGLPMAFLSLLYFSESGGN